MAHSIKNLIAALVIAISGYLVWVQVLPVYSVNSLLKEKVEEKSIFLQRRTETIQQIDKLREGVNAKYAELQRLGLVLPNKRGTPEVIASIEDIYSRSGLVLPELSVSDDKEDKDPNKLTIQSFGAGTYVNFFSLLNFLEKSIRLFDVDSIEVGVTEDRDSDDPVLNFTIKGKSYWLK